MFKLIIVDDEAAIRNGLSSFNWPSLGFEVTAVLKNGKEALDWVISHPVDAILCDIKMDKMSGLEFTSIVHERQLPIEMVLLTGYQDMEYISQAMHSGCYDYLLKPTKFSRLVQVFQGLRKVLEAKWELQIAKDGETQETDEDRIIRYAKSYVRAHIASSSLKSLSEYLGVSPVYISRLFKKKGQTNFSDFYQDIRLEKAKELLCLPSYSIAYIPKFRPKL